MRLKSIAITNFRGLSHVEATFSKSISAIVGPNGIGKTSILEAIRITKGLLAPRFSQETDLVLQNVGALSPNTRALNWNALAADVSRAMEVSLEIEFSEEEIQILESEAGRLSLLHVRNARGIPPNQDDLALIQYLSSPSGREVHQQAQLEIRNRLEKLRESKKTKLHLFVDASSQVIRGEDLFSQELVRVLEEAQPPSHAYLTYFPADRAMPMGEVNIQVGSADSAAQMHAHIAVPQQKYNRLKQFIVNQTLLGESARNQLAADFELIFDELLTGKRLKALTITPTGSLSVMIEETNSGKSYDIDLMSSGEKGLILQFLLMRRSVALGGIIMIDEPELHLNPAVCSLLLPFLEEHVVKYGQTQVLLCTHSPEILAGAFESPTCDLFHLRSGSDLSPVFPQDRKEVFEALRRLGAQAGDILFSRGSIFVEGPDDAALLEAGFSNRVSGYKVAPLQGRSEVEKVIRTLQDAESNARLDTTHVFIFDRDYQLTDLKSTDKVRVLQWDRNCFENYLLDPDSVFDASSSLKLRDPPESRGSLRNQMRELALSQIAGLVARRVYKDMEPENPGLRPSEIEGRDDFGAIGELLVSRLIRIKEEVSSINRDAWVSEFKNQCQKSAEELHQEWAERWQLECNGKKLLHLLYRGLAPSVPLTEFKKRILTGMARSETENWRVVDSLLTQTLRSQPPLPKLDGKTG